VFYIYEFHVSPFKKLNSEAFRLLRKKHGMGTDAHCQSEGIDKLYYIPTYILTHTDLN